MSDNKPSAREVARANYIAECEGIAYTHTGISVNLKAVQKAEEAAFYRILSAFEKKVKRETVERCIEIVASEKRWCSESWGLTKAEMLKLLEDEA